MREKHCQLEEFINVKLIEICTVMDHRYSYAVAPRPLSRPLAFVCHFLRNKSSVLVAGGKPVQVCFKLMHKSGQSIVL